MLSRIGLIALELLAASCGLLAGLVRPSRPPSSRGASQPEVEPRPKPPAFVSYPQLRHLVVGTVFLIFGLWLAVAFVVQTRDVLILLGISIILAVALRPTVERISLVRIPWTRWTIPRTLAILLIYLLLAVIASGIGLLAVPQLGQELQGFISNLPDYLNRLDQWLEGLRPYLPIPELASIEQQLVNQLLGNLAQAFNVLLFAVGILTSLVSIGMVLVFTFFLIMDADLIHDHLLLLIPPSRREAAEAMAGEMGRKIEGWLKGTLLLALILGVATTTAMYALSMPYPYLLGFAAAIFELVPIIGAYLGAAPAVAVALFGQPLWKLIAVVSYFLVIQQLENNVLAPQVFGRQVHMPPLLVILALLMGGSIMGIVGALIAVPAAAILQVLWAELIVPEITRRNSEE